VTAKPGHVPLISTTAVPTSINSTSTNSTMGAPPSLRSFVEGRGNLAHGASFDFRPLFYQKKFAGTYRFNRREQGQR
jgi:hypothetical protein